ncbi:MAG: LPS export ABC transporter periplasmic protein LptC [Gammaproteobacteria bacterium]|nr:LPS export ABC transporter periplasmic protein LptC [Gammaproteobacteria bacterium]
MTLPPRYLSIAGAGLLAAGSWWLLQYNTEEPSYSPLPHSPDFILEQFTATTMGLNGLPDKRLSAEEMRHYPDDDSTELIKPRMTVFEEKNPPWRITSDTGWISGDREIVLLNGKVQIDREEAPDIKPLHLTTTNLTIHPEQNYAETEEYVYLESRNSWAESTGMQTWFKKPVRIKLLADVRGRYEAE